MEKYHIKGGNVLSGEVNIAGAKNAALPILAASVITRGENSFLSCPDISDVDSMIKILKSLGCRVKKEKNYLLVDATGISQCRITDDLMKEMRSSVFLAGSLLARCGEATISNPGGCNIGKRPIDIHIKGLQQMGAVVEQGREYIHMEGRNLRGAHLKLEYPSVGATENLMLAALAAEGTTVIENSAREPEIKALQDYINKCGGRIRGAGSSVICIEGKSALIGCETKIIPDRIEAGTYLLMSLATGGDILLKEAEPSYLEPLLNLLWENGYIVKTGDGIIYASAKGSRKIRCNIDTAPYPGFPTDLQPQLAAFLTCRGHNCVIKENIFENRFEYAKQLIKMGADIEISQKQVIIKGNDILCGEKVKAQDLRGGAALVIAGLMAEGETVVEDTKYIKRGYSGFEEKIRELGGEIKEYGKRKSDSEECEKKETP